MAVVPNNRQRRETAKRKLDRQMQRRSKQAKQRRIAMIAGGAVAILLVAGLVTFEVMHAKNSHHGGSSATNSAAPDGSSSAPSPTTEAAPDSAALPAFKPSPQVGANCQYPASPAPAAKAVKPPRTGKIPTDPATVSVSMATNQGNIGLLLANNESPCTVNSFASLVGQKYFDKTPCHRLTTSPSLSVLQCGDPTGKGTGGPGYQFANEYPSDQHSDGDRASQQPVLYPRGTLAMANAGPNTNGSQFFLVYRDSQLPPNYTVFGKIQDDGLGVLDKIAKAGVVGGKEDGAPSEPVTITSARLD